MKMLISIIFNAVLSLSGGLQDTNEGMIRFSHQFKAPIVYESSLTLRAVGDIMLHKSVQKYGVNNKDGFKPIFYPIKKELLNADITFGNLEIPISKSRKPSGYPMFNAPLSIIPALKMCDFDILSTSNNHAIDKGKIGMLETIEELEKAKIIHVGTHRTKESPLKVINKNGIKLGFLGFTEHTNGMKAPKDDVVIYYLNRTKKDTVDRAIKMIKQAKKEVDFLILSIHFGAEYLLKPEKWKPELIHKLLDAGGDLVLGHHPHVLQEGEYYVTKDKRETFIIYSMGNFISGQNRGNNDGSVRPKKAHRSDGVILDVKLVKLLDKTYIQQVHFIPTWTSINRRVIEIKLNSKKNKKIRVQKIVSSIYKVINLKKVIDTLPKKSSGLKKYYLSRYDIIKERYIPKVNSKKIASKGNNR